MDDHAGQQCKASNRRGARCSNRAMRGQAICRMHGGLAPQNLAKAAERLRALEHPAIDQVEFEMLHGDSSAVRFAVAKWILELNGHKVVVQQQTDHEVTIRVIDEAQPIVLERVYELNGRADGHH